MVVHPRIVRRFAALLIGSVAAFGLVSCGPTDKACAVTSAPAAVAVSPAVMPSIPRVPVMPRIPSAPSIPRPAPMVPRPAPAPAPAPVRPSTPTQPRQSSGPFSSPWFPLWFLGGAAAGSSGNDDRSCD